MAEPQREVSMGELTRKLADEREPVQEGSGTLAWDADGGTGASQQQDRSGQAPDSAMAQQFHQPRQGSEGGHATDDGGAETPDGDG